MTPPTDRPVITPEMVERFAAYYRLEPVWGSLHIVLEDMNLKDDHVRFCIQWAETEGDEEGKALGEILLTLTRTQRYHLADRAEAVVGREEQARRDARVISTGAPTTGATYVLR